MSWTLKNFVKIAGAYEKLHLRYQKDINLRQHI
jgi:hypothetical protein